MLVASAALAGCGASIEQQALGEFKAEQPDVTVYEQFVGEGDSDNAYMHFRYTQSASAESLEQVWLYQRQGDGSWRVIFKAGPKPPRSNFDD